MTLLINTNYSSLSSQVKDFFYFVQNTFKKISSVRCVSVNKSKMMMDDIKWLQMVRFSNSRYDDGKTIKKVASRQVLSVTGLRILYRFGIMNTFLYLNEAS